MSTTSFRRLSASVLAVVLTIVLTVAGGCASRLEFPGPSSDLTLNGDLRRPEAAGPRPAVVLLAPCGGITSHMGEWAAWLNREGYVTLIVDSFGPRRSRTACLGQRPTEGDAARDAIDALAYLRTLSFVDGQRVAVMGWSHGAGAALRASSSFGPGPVSLDRIAFRAAVAFYPGCLFLDVRTSTPTLLLLAGRDDWTPAGQCVAIGEMARNEDAPVRWEVYPDAQHAFDRPDAAPYLGHVMAYDGAAAAAAREAVRKFLAEQLR